MAVNERCLLSKECEAFLICWRRGAKGNIRFVEGGSSGKHSKHSKRIGRIWEVGVNAKIDWWRLGDVIGLSFDLLSNQKLVDDACCAMSIACFSEPSSFAFLLFCTIMSITPPLMA